MSSRAISEVFFLPMTEDVAMEVSEVSGDELSDNGRITKENHRKRNWS